MYPSAPAEDEAKNVAGQIRTINLELLAKALSQLTDVGPFLSQQVFPIVGVEGVFEALFLDAAVGATTAFDVRKVCGQVVGAPRSIGAALKNMERLRRKHSGEDEDEESDLQRVPVYQFYLVLDMLRTCGGAKTPTSPMVWVAPGSEYSSDKQAGFSSAQKRTEALQALQQDHLRVSSADPSWTRTFMQSLAHPYLPPAHHHYPWLIIALFDPDLEATLLDSEACGLLEADAEDCLALQRELVEIKKTVKLGEYGSVGPNGLLQVQAEEVVEHAAVAKRDVHEMRAAVDGVLEGQGILAVDGVLEEAVTAVAASLVLPSNKVCVEQHLQQELLELKMLYQITSSGSAAGDQMGPRPSDQPVVSFTAPRILPVGRMYEYRVDAAPKEEENKLQNDFDLTLVKLLKPFERNWPVIGATRNHK